MFEHKECFIGAWRRSEEHEECGENTDVEEVYTLHLRYSSFTILYVTLHSGSVHRDYYYTDNTGQL